MWSLRSLFDYIIPNACPVCNKDFFGRAPLCSSCENVIKPSSLASHCPVCGLRLYSERQRCLSCLKNPSSIDGLHFYCEYKGTIKTLIQTMKFHSLKHLAVYIGGLMAEIEIPPVDAVVPIPLSKERLIERGFNQSYIMAKVISRKKEIPLKHLLLRLRNTPAQSSLKRKDRLKNIKGAFKLNGNPSSIPQNILVVDDVYTTGATVNEAALTLKSAGARVVYALVFARTPTE